jgi:hypothetical protein
MAPYLYDAAFWANAGGDFLSGASATVEVGDPGAVGWGSTAAAVADVQAWLDFPDSNHGWLLLGEEDAPTTAKRFGSREADDPAARPQLRVEYSCRARRSSSRVLRSLCHAYCEKLDCDETGRPLPRLRSRRRSHAAARRLALRAAGYRPRRHQDALDNRPDTLNADQADGDLDGVLRLWRSPRDGSDEAWILWRVRRIASPRSRCGRHPGSRRAPRERTW